MVIFHSYVKLPEGISAEPHLEFSRFFLFSLFTFILFPPEMIGTYKVVPLYGSERKICRIHIGTKRKGKKNMILSFLHIYIYIYMIYIYITIIYIYINYIYGVSYIPMVIHDWMMLQTPQLPSPVLWSDRRPGRTLALGPGHQSGPFTFLPKKKSSGDRHIADIFKKK